MTANIGLQHSALCIRRGNLYEREGRTERESKPKENGRNWVAWEPFMCPLLEAVGYASLLLNRAFEDIYEITLSNFHSPRGAGPHCSVSLRIARTGNAMEAGDKAEQETKKGFWRRGRRKSREGVRLRGERPSIPFLPSACSSSVRRRIRGG